MDISAPVCILCGNNLKVRMTSASWYCNEHGYADFAHPPITGKRKGGVAGGKARAASMTAQKRTDIARKAAQTRWGKQMDDKDDYLVVSIKLTSGKFDSSISIPLFADEDAKKAFIDAWLVLIEAGIKAGQSSRKNQNSTKKLVQDNPSI